MARAKKAGQRKAAAAGGIGARGGSRLPKMAADRIPSHTFGSSTIPRAAASGRKKKAPTEPDADDAYKMPSSLAAPKRYDPDHDGDNDASASGDTDHDYVLPNGQPGPKARGAAKNKSPVKAAAPTKTNELAAPKKGMGFKAAAASAAKSAGVSPQAGAAMVAAASQKASPKAKAANPNLKKVAKKGQKKGPGGKFL